ncbi:hypothetical protein CerSpe_064890 [Prunus speciosa]
MLNLVLFQILLEDDDIEEALNLLDQASSERNELDTLLFNTILEKACEKEVIEVVEFVVEWMHQEKVEPDPATCHFVFSAYANSGFHSTAMEALQVLSKRMICEEDGSFPEKAEFEDDYIFAEDTEAESRIVQLFKDSEEDLAVALLNLRWCAVLGFPISWPEDCHLTTLPGKEPPNHDLYIGGIMTPVSFPLLLLFFVVVERNVRPPQEGRGEGERHR